MLIIHNQATGIQVCSNLTIANTFRSRLVGLLGRQKFEPGEGLLILPSSGVHTFGMAFDIDILALDRANKVVGVFENVGSWRVCGVNLKTKRVLEVPAGQIRERRVALGDVLTVSEI